MATGLEFDEEYLDLLPKWWKRFFLKFSEIETLPIYNWKPVHLIAHFCFRYYQHFGKQFSFSIKNAPGKSPEMFLIKKLFQVLGTISPKLVKKYIDWVFDTKIIPNNRQIRSLGFFANSAFCNEFKAQLAESNKIYRYTPLPMKYKEVVDSLKIPASTFGDLSFAKKILDDKVVGFEQYEALFTELYKIGFEFDMIQNLR